MPAPSPSPLHDILRYDDVAVKFLFEHYYVPLVIFAKNYLPDIEDCKDVVQGIFLHIVENREKFTSIDNLKAYLYQTTQNRCLKQLRHEGVKQRYIFESQAMGEEAFYLDHILEEEVYTQLIRPSMLCRGNAGRFSGWYSKIKAIRKLPKSFPLVWKRSNPIKNKEKLYYTSV